MPQGDWHPDAKMRPGIINLSVGQDGEIVHVGVGFDVISKNGLVVQSSGYSWDLPDEHRAALEAALRELVETCAEAEGLSGVVYREYGAGSGDLPSIR